MKNKMSYLCHLKDITGLSTKKAVRITPDKKASVYDIIEVIGSKTYHSTWEYIRRKNQEVLEYIDYFKFTGQGQRNTPVVTAEGLIFLINCIPGEKAKHIRQECAKILTCR